MQPTDHDEAGRYGPDLDEARRYDPDLDEAGRYGPDLDEAGRYGPDLDEAGRKVPARPEEFDPHPANVSRRHASATHLPARWTVVDALTSDRFGVFATAQAVELGMSTSALSDQVRARRLFRLHNGVYCRVPPRQLTPLAVKYAAVLACGNGAALSHLSAAIHTGFIARLDPQIVDVTVPRRGGQSRSGIRIHRSSTLRPRDIERIYGIPTTTVARTLLDLAGVLALDQVEDAIDEAARMELLLLHELREQIDHNHGRPEAARLRTVLDLWDEINALTDSKLEKLVRPIITSVGVPQPELQQWLDLGDGGQPIRTDFLWRQERLIGEADSHRWHGNRLERDTRRDQRAARVGFRTLRVTRRQVLTEPDRVGVTLAVVYADCRAAAVSAGRLPA